MSKGPSAGPTGRKATSPLTQWAPRATMWAVIYLAVCPTDRLSAALPTAESLSHTLASCCRPGVLARRAGEFSEKHRPRRYHSLRRLRVSVFTLGDGPAPERSVSDLFAIFDSLCLPFTVWLVCPSVPFIACLPSRQWVLRHGVWSTGPAADAVRAGPVVDVETATGIRIVEAVRPFCQMVRRLVWES